MTRQISVTKPIGTNLTEEHVIAMVGKGLDKKIATELRLLIKQRDARRNDTIGPNLTDVVVQLRTSDIVVRNRRRALDSEVVTKIAENLNALAPITVRMDEGTPILVAGLHRLEAHKVRGAELIGVLIFEGDETEAELWEIAENLHRAELTVIERSAHTAEYARIAERRKVSAQVGQKTQGRPEGGKSAAARELGITRQEVDRSIQIAGITPEAKAEAKDSGLEDNQSVLLEIAATPPEQQVETVKKIAKTKNEHRRTSKSKGASERSLTSPPEIVSMTFVQRMRFFAEVMSTDYINEEVQRNSREVRKAARILENITHTMFEATGTQIRAVSVDKLEKTLRPIIARLMIEGKRNMAVMSPFAVLSATNDLELALEKWTGKHRNDPEAGHSASVENPG